MSIYYKDWSSFSCFLSAEYTQSFLKKCYGSLHITDIDSKSYQNCYPFMYFLEHGKLYYQQALQAPLSIKPVLLFYGLVHLIKACLLTLDPSYPNSTSVLAHGVSTRKLKKQDYLFSQDEVKIQKNGLFSFMSEKMFHHKNLEGDKVKMGYLFKQIPELSELIFSLEGSRSFLDIEYSKEKVTIPKEILNLYYMNEQRLKEYLEDNGGVHIKSIKLANTTLELELLEPFSNNSLIKWNNRQKKYSISTNKEVTPFSNEIINHYLILYNLSMIARYEIEWWSELLKTMPNKDYPYIESFLLVSSEKGPQLIFDFLKQSTLRDI